MEGRGAKIYELFPQKKKEIIPKEKPLSKEKADQGVMSMARALKTVEILAKEEGINPDDVPEPFVAYETDKGRVHIPISEETKINSDKTQEQKRVGNG